MTYFRGGTYRAGRRQTGAWPRLRRSGRALWYLAFDDTLAPERVRARGLWRPEVVARLVSEHLAGARTHGDRIWTLVILELWMREYLDGRGAWRLT